MMRVMRGKLDLQVQSKFPSSNKQLQGPYKTMDPVNPLDRTMGKLQPSRKVASYLKYEGLDIGGS